MTCNVSLRTYIILLVGLLLPPTALCKEPVITRGSVVSQSNKTTYSFVSYFWQDGIVVDMDESLRDPRYPFDGLQALFNLGKAKNFDEYAACCTKSSLPVLIKVKKLVQSDIADNLNRTLPWQHRLYLIVALPNQNPPQIITVYDPMPSRPANTLIFNAHIASKEDAVYKIDHSDIASHNPVKMDIDEAKWDAFGVTPEFVKKLAATTQSSH